MLKLFRLKDKWVYLNPEGVDYETPTKIFISEETYNTLNLTGATGVKTSDNTTVSTDAVNALIATVPTMKLVELTDGGYQLTREDGTNLGIIPASNVNNIVTIFEGGGEAEVTTNEN